jgi:hypothetical protein
MVSSLLLCSSPWMFIDPWAALVFFILIVLIETQIRCQERTKPMNKISAQYFGFGTNLITGLMELRKTTFP